MNTFNESDHPRGGTPNNPGQFSAKTHKEAECSLEDEDVTEPNWGEVAIRDGSRTPWGPVQGYTNIADGIVQVYTAGHGGVRLSPERNRAIPKPLRNSNRWYEEDCEAMRVGLVFPKEFADTWFNGEKDAQGIADYCAGSVKNWSPDEYEAATGEQVHPEESSVLQERIFEKQSENQFVTTSAVTFDGDKNYVLVEAKRKSDGMKRTFAVKADTYRTLENGHSYVVDESAAVDVTAPPEKSEEPQKPYTSNHLNLAGLPESSLRRVENEMTKNWRLNEEILNPKEMIANGKVYGKKAFHNGKETEYFLSLKDNYSIPVSAATWKALDQIPDVRSEEHKLHDEMRRSTAVIRRAEQQIFKARAKSDYESKERAEKNLARAKAKRQTLEAQSESLANKARQERTVETQRILGLIQRANTHASVTV